MLWAKRKLKTATGRRAWWLSVLLVVVFSGFGLFALPADSPPMGAFLAKLNNAGVPGGWVNLPMLTGTIPVEPEPGRVIFEQLRSLGIQLGVTTAGGLTLVVEGEDGNLVSGMCVAGDPELLVTMVNDLCWQSIVHGDFAVCLDPQLVRPGSNHLAMVLPESFLGGIIRVSGAGITDSYGMVDDLNMYLSWEQMIVLAESGVFALRYQVLSPLTGELKEFSLNINPNSGSLEIATGF